MSSNPKPDGYVFGRPTLYNEELANKICEAVATDTDCLDDICAKHDDFPNPQTIYAWRLKYENFSKKYIQSMHSRGNLYAEETIKIAKQRPTYIDSEGNERVDTGAVAWQKMNVNLRQWHASKLAPKTYGDNAGLIELNERLARLENPDYDLMKKVDKL
jgi:hypothetical protein